MRNGKSHLTLHFWQSYLSYILMRTFSALLLSLLFTFHGQAALCVASTCADELSSCQSMVEATADDCCCHTNEAEETQQSEESESCSTDCNLETHAHNESPVLPVEYRSLSLKCTVVAYTALPLEEKVISIRYITTKVEAPLGKQRSALYCVWLI